MKKIAIIENIHKDGLKLLDEHSNYDYQLITDTSEENLIKELPKFDACGAAVWLGMWLMPSEVDTVGV